MNRFGSIKISKKLIEVDSKNISQAFAKIGFLLMYIENMYHGMIMYIGFSEMFREVKQGDEAPGYTIEIKRDDYGRFMGATAKEVKL